VTPTWMTVRACLARMKKANSKRKKRSVTCKHSHAHRSLAWFHRKGAQFCPARRGVRACLIYFCMGRVETCMPSLRNAPRRRSAPQRRFCTAISLMKATVSAEIFGLADAALDVYFQYSLNPWRCHRKSVSGWMMKSACFHVRAILASSTRSMRSVLVQAGRLTCRRRILNCWRRSACSAISWDLLLGRSVSVPTMRAVLDGLVQSTKWWWND